MWGMFERLLYPQILEKQKDLLQVSFFVSGTYRTPGTPPSSQRSNGKTIPKKWIVMVALGQKSLQLFCLVVFK